MNQNLKDLILSDSEEDRILAGQLIAYSDEFYIEEFKMLRINWDCGDRGNSDAYLDMVHAMDIDKYLTYLELK